MKTEPDVIEPPRYIRVQTRRTRTRPRGNRRIVTKETWPEIRLSNRWLLRAGFEPGDVVQVVSPEPGALVLRVARKARPEDPPGRLQLIVAS